jgi:hypothetical protein
VNSFLRNLGCALVLLPGAGRQNVLKNKLDDGFPAWIATLRDTQDTGQNPVMRQNI